MFLVALVDNRERYRVECDETDVERVAELVRGDLTFYLSAVAPRMSRLRQGAAARSARLRLVHS